MIVCVSFVSTALAVYFFFFFIISIIYMICATSFDFLVVSITSRREKKDSTQHMTLYNQQLFKSKMLDAF